MDTIKSYCTQNEGDCSTCSLVNYGRDCRNQTIEGTKEHEIDNDIADIITDDLKRQGR